MRRSLDRDRRRPVGNRASIRGQPSATQVCHFLGKICLRLETGSKGVDAIVRGPSVRVPKPGDEGGERIVGKES